MMPEVEQVSAGAVSLKDNHESKRDSRRKAVSRSVTIYEFHAIYPQPGGSQQCRSLSRRR